jgi:predicted DNA-binding ribbon-helix-helix protein
LLLLVVRIGVPADPAVPPVTKRWISQTRREFVTVLKALAPVSSYSSAVPNLLYQNTGGFGEALMKSSVVKRSIVIDGHKTSVSLEDAFWSSLKEIAEAQQAPLSMVVGEIDQTRQQGNLSSAIRLFVLDHVRTHFRRD